MRETYKRILENYNIVDLVVEDLKTKSKKELKKQYKSELKLIRDNWNDYSHDNSNIILLLKIKCLKKKYYKKDIYKKNHQ